MNKNDCEHPELKPEHGKCSDELMLRCHGEIRLQTDCEHPELKPAEGSCSEEQIKHCHGENKA